MAAESCLSQGFRCIEFWRRAGPDTIATWVLIGAGSALSVVSLPLLLLGLAEVRGWFVCGQPCCHTLLWPNIAVFFLWLPPLGLSIYVAVQHIWIGLLFAPFGGVLAVLHFALIVTYRRLERLAKASDNPTRSLLTSQVSGAAGRDCASSDAPGTASNAAVVQNPFTATYGILPGTSQYGYTIFIPTEEGAYSGLPSARNRETPPRT